MRSLIYTALVLATISFPFLIYYLHRYTQSSQLVGWFILVISLLKLILYISEKGIKQVNHLWIYLLVNAIILALVYSNFTTFHIFIPTIINGLLLANFSFSLLKERTIIELFARKQVENLSIPEVSYCRKLTIVWCCFFLINGSIPAYLGIKEHIGLWTIYTGLISYLLMGTLFFFEMTYRYWRFRNYGTTPIDKLYKKIFPERIVADQQDPKSGKPQ